LLLVVRVDPKLEPLVTPHDNKNHTLVCKNSKRIPPSETRHSQDSDTQGIARFPFGRTPFDTLENHDPLSVRQGFLPALKDGVSAPGAN
jgi:hypothetical protein